MKHNYFKITLNNGIEHLIRTEMSMLDLGNEIRNKVKLSVEDLSGNALSLKSADVYSVEIYRPSRRQNRGD